MGYGQGLYEVKSRRCKICHKLLKIENKEGNKIFLKKKNIFMNKSLNLEYVVHVKCKPKLILKIMDDTNE